MKKIAQKAVTILLIMALSVSALLYLFYDVAQVRFTMEAQESIHANEKLELIKVSLAEFNNRKGEELWHNGALYDISSYTVVGQEVIVTVLHDGNEESLVKRIADSFEPNDKCAPDNGVHIKQHRVHFPGDGKILVVPFQPPFRSVATVSPSDKSVAVYSSQQPGSVIKPPPRHLAA